MSNNYWLFARPIYVNDGGSRTEIKYYEYSRRIDDEGISYGYESDYVDAERPCLVLKNLFADLFTGSRVYYDTASGRRLINSIQPPLIDEYDAQTKSITYFFPFLIKKKEYESRFRRRKRSDQNPYANTLYEGLCKTPAEYIGAVEGACELFFSEGCSVLDTDKINEYLISRIEIFIDYVCDNNRFSAVERGNEELKTKSDKAMRAALKSFSGNLPFLLSRLLFLAGLNWDKIDSLTLRVLLLGERASDSENECDVLYVKYCNTNKTDLSRLRLAYQRLNPDAKYYKEINSDYAEQLIRSDLPEKRDLAYKILKKLSDGYPDYGRGISLLALCHRDGIGCEANKEASRALYQIAMEMGDESAILTIAEELYSSPIQENKIRAIEYCQRILNMSPSASSELIGRAAFILGEIYLSVQRDRVCAKKYYCISAEAGYSTALHRLRMIDRPNRPSPSEANTEHTEDHRERHLIVSGCEDVVESIRSGVSTALWQMRLITERNGQDTDLRQLINEYLEGEYGEQFLASEYPTRSVFVFAESDSDINLRNALYLLDRLYAKHNDLLVSTDPKKEEKIKRLIGSFDIYLSADYEAASMMIDSSLAEMGEDLYFRVHICDEGKELAEQLLYRAPLFIPTLRDEGEPKVVTFGNSDFLYSFIREATASCYMINHPVKISAICGNISTLENKFRQNCGGIYTAPLKRKIMPEFIHYDLSRPELDDMASGRPVGNDQSTADAKRAIAEGNYFVVDVGSDMENVLFARNLRTWLLRSDSAFRRIPFIAVRCRDSVNAFWISRLHAGGFRHDPHWYNDYDFYIIGMMSDIYPSVITDSLLERIALNVHLSYDSSNVDEEIAHFWQSSYSRDSSRATALGLIYRMYDASIFLKNYRDYHSLSFAKLTALADEYQKLIQENSSAILTYAMAEQSRWNCFMLSRGWLPATDKQMRAYMTVGGHSSHKHELSKLHPFIRDWEDINGGEGSLYRRARESTLKSIADTRKFLTIVRPVQSLESSTKNK